MSEVARQGGKNISCIAITCLKVYILDKRGTKRVASNSAVVPQVRLQTSNSGKTFCYLSQQRRQRLC